jgi:histidinol phosphatase-like PHP family hydrolase
MAAFDQEIVRKTVAPTISNGELAELLALEAEKVSDVRQRALRRAARAAFLWPQEAAAMLENGRSLTELNGVGPYISRLLTEWIETSPNEKPRVAALRRDFLTLATARQIIADDPAFAARLHGDLQMHTRWSDGSGSIAEMAAAAGTRGYEYIAITDHSKGLKIAGGIDEEAIAEQGREIASLNQAARSGGVTVLRSIELNLNPRGEGDLEPACLRSLDLVLGSFHSALRTDRDQTERYLAALRNPQVQILGHPRGRIYNFRLGLKCDWSRVFAEAVRLDKALEIDSYPDRQDLNVALLKIARHAGARISLGTDAHHPWQLQFIEFGLAAARKAKISPDRIINFLPLPALRDWIAQARSRSAGA